MNPFGWPNKVWQPGTIHSGKQLWYSTIVTKADRERRQEYEDRYYRRQDDELEKRR